MLQKQTTKRQAVTFKHFTQKKYAVFQSLKREIRIGCLSVCALTFAHTQSPASRSDSMQIIRQQMPEVLLHDAQVVGTRVQPAFAETAHTVSVITRSDIEQSKAQSINDVLKLCAGIDVRQRGGFGVQTDIGMGGGTFDQISILLNGVSVNNPQTGHLSADFPVAIADIERIEIYDGASARIFGSQALNGAINIITRVENSDVAGVHADGGSFGTVGSGAYLNLAATHVLNRLSGDFLRSDGGTDNSAFHKYRAFYQGRYLTPLLQLSWQYGFASQRYGANTFYSAAYPNQWEGNSRHIVSARATLTPPQNRAVVTLQSSWVRSFDHFQLINNSNKGENFHRNDVFTTNLTAAMPWSLGRTTVGVDLRYEGILSTNLGRPLDEREQVQVQGQDSIFYNHRDKRTNASVFAQHEISIQDFLISLGLMTNYNTSVSEECSFYPGIDASYRPVSTLKLFAAWNKSMRLPTFTDLYYKSPTQEGNLDLHPEKSSTFKVGAEFQDKGLHLSLNGIYRHGTDMIDWVMYNSTDVYHATNFQLDNYELQAQADYHFNEVFGEESFLQTFSAGYFYNYQKRKKGQEIYQSNYALDYLRHKLVVSLSHRIWNCLSASWNLRWQERRGTRLAFVNGTSERVNYHPYALLSCNVQWKKPSYNLYVSCENITNHHYYDLGSVRQPGFWLMAGGIFNFSL